MDNCSICTRKLESEEPTILMISGYGNPRYMCDECSAEIEEACYGRDAARIAEAMDRIGSKMLVSDPDGPTYTTVTTLLERAKERAIKINEGSYDFALDEQFDDEGFDEIPEELAETEEDKEKDRIDEEKQKKFDKVYNYLLIGVGVALAAVVVWKIISTFFLK